MQMLRSVGQPRWHRKQPWLVASTACTQQTGGFRKKHFITASSRFIFSLSCILKCELFVFLWENLDSAQHQHFIWRMRKGFTQNPKAISECITALNEWLEQKQGKKGSFPDSAADLLCKHRQIFHCSCCSFLYTLSFPS